MIKKFLVAFSSLVIGLSLFSHSVSAEVEACNTPATIRVFGKLTYFIRSGGVAPAPDAFVRAVRDCDGKVIKAQAGPNGWYEVYVSKKLYYIEAKDKYGNTFFPHVYSRITEDVRYNFEAFVDTVPTPKPTSTPTPTPPLDPITTYVAI